MRRSWARSQTRRSDALSAVQPDAHPSLSAALSAAQLGARMPPQGHRLGNGPNSATLEPPVGA